MSALLDLAALGGAAKRGLAGAPLLEWGGLALGALSVATVAFGCARDEDGVVRRVMTAYVATLSRRCAALFLRWDVRAIVVAQLAAVYAAAAAALMLHRADLLLGGALAVLVPTTLLGYLRQKRRAAIEAQTDAFVLAFASALRATASVGDAFRSLGHVVSEPLKSEILLAEKHMRLGSTLEDALLAMARRIESRAFDTALTAVLVGQRVGGNLPTILATTGAAIRELHRLDRMSRAKTASARFQAWAVSAAPLVFVLGVEQTSPGFFRPLVETRPGNLALVVAAILWVLAVTLARRILRVVV